MANCKQNAAPSLHAGINHNKARANQRGHKPPNDTASVRYLFIPVCLYMAQVGRVSGAALIPLELGGWGLLIGG